MVPTPGFTQVPELVNVWTSRAAALSPVTVAPVKSTVEPDGKSVVTPDRPIARDVAVVPPMFRAPVESIELEPIVMFECVNVSALATAWENPRPAACFCAVTDAT